MVHPDPMHIYPEVDFCVYCSNYHPGNTAEHCKKFDELSLEQQVALYEEYQKGIALGIVSLTDKDNMVNEHWQ